MLSKIEYFEGRAGQQSLIDSPDRLRATIETNLRACGVSGDLVPADLGTLGICFYLRSGDSRYFVKTHLPYISSRLNLQKEAEIMLHLYGRDIIIDCLEFEEKQGSRLCLIMKELLPIKGPLEPDQLIKIVNRYSDTLRSCQPNGLSPSLNLSRYLDSAQLAVRSLYDKSFIQRSTVSELTKLLLQLESNFSTLPHCLCHGDLSPKNIMTDGSRLIVIDWEDTFWGIPSYDYLYWLTFMENRDHLRNFSFGSTNLNSTVERAVLALVILLKTSLSVSSNSYQNHRVSIEARISEVLSLP